jgi:hypothetical protein
MYEGRSSKRSKVGAKREEGSELQGMAVAVNIAGEKYDQHG